MGVDFICSLPDLAALARLYRLGAFFQNRHRIQVTWLSPTRAAFNGRYMTAVIQGELEFRPGLVRFRGIDPGVLWRQKAQEYIESKLRVYLDPATPVDVLPMA